jgi:hypothetical protein
MNEMLALTLVLWARPMTYAPVSHADEQARLTIAKL